ncbi:MAG: FixH family protein [Candidatus Karelsulcia muelleri]
MKINYNNYKIVVCSLLFGFITFNSYLFLIKQSIKSELISKKYYEEEINFQKKIDSKKNAKFLKNKIKFKISKKGIHIFFPKEKNYLNLNINYSLIRYSNSLLDNNNSINTKNNYFIIISSKTLKKGNYNLILRWIVNNKEFLIEKDIIWKI